MKKILTVVTVALVGVTGFLATKQLMQPTPDVLVEVYQPDWWPSEDMEYEKEDYKMSQEFARLAIVNQTTGAIDSRDVLMAREEVKRMLGQARNSRSLGLDWIFMGPDNIGGRSRAILFDKNNPNRALAGGVTGGLWLSDDAGLSWRVYDKDDTLASIGVVCLVQAANGDIYAGTGENPNNLGASAPNGTADGESGKIGEGVWKSTDGGNTFVQLAATIPAIDNSQNTDWAFVPSLAAHPSDGNTIIAGTGRGARITRDGGQTWSNLSSVSTVNTGFVQDLEIASDGTVHLTINGQYFRGSIDDPASYRVGTGFGKTFRRLMLGMSPQDNNYVYLIGCDNPGRTNGVYRSTDGGQNWNHIASPNLPSESFNPTGEQGWFDMEIAVHPLDKNRAYVAGQLAMWAYQFDETTSKNLWWPVSTWAGGFAPQFFSNYVHADQHRIVFHPTNPDWMYVCSDGGIHRTLNSRVPYGQVPTYAIINKGFGVTQFYGISAGIDGRILGGTQDNGEILIDFSGNGVRQGRRVNDGDGFFTDISKTNPNAMFGGTYYGAIERTSNAYNSFGGQRYFDENIDDPATDGAGTPDCGAGFYTPQLLWENTDANSADYGKGLIFLGTYCGIWAAYDALDFGKIPTWFQISTTNTGLFPSSGNAVVFTSFDVSEDGEYLYAGTVNGDVYRIEGLSSVVWEYDDNGTPTATADDFFDPTAAGITTTRIARFANRYVGSVSIDPNDNGHVLVTLGNYGNSVYVYRSFNADVAPSASDASNFTSIQGNLPRMPVYSGVIDAYDRTNYILGTEMGMYTSTSGGNSWSLDNNGFPLSPVYMLKQEKIDNLDSDCYAIYAGTHGRGIYMTKSLTDPTCRVVTSVDQPQRGDILTVAPNPANTQTTLSFSLESSRDIELEVYDVMGRKLMVKDLGRLMAGNHTESMDVSRLQPGNYLVVLRTNNYTETQQLVIAR